MIVFFLEKLKCKKWYKYYWENERASIICISSVRDSISTVYEATRDLTARFLVFVKC